MFDGKYFRAWFENNILFLEYKTQLVLTYQVATQVLKSRLTFQQNKQYTIFCDPSGISNTDTRALEYLSREGTLLVTAIAFYVDSPLNNLITEFFLETYSNKIPTGIFRNKYQAIKFLTPYSQ